MVRLVANKIKELPIPPRDRPALRKVMEALYTSHTNGALTRALVPVAELARDWKSTTPLENVVDAAADEGLIEVNQLLVRGQPEIFLGLPQDALAQTAASWDEDRKRRAYGRSRIQDTLWIMIPMLFLAAAIAFTVTRNFFGLPATDMRDIDAALAQGQKLDPGAPYIKVKREELEERLRLADLQEMQLERARWPLYVGDLVRAEQAWNNDNPLLARQILLTQQEVKKLDLRDFEWYYLWNKIVGKGPDAAGHKGIITSVAIAPDGAIGASASTDGVVKIWDLAQGKEIGAFDGKAGALAAISFAPDGKTLASGGDDKLIRLWRVNIGPVGLDKAEPQTLAGHTDKIRALAFGTDGLVSGGADGQVITWDLAKRAVGKDFKEHKAAIAALALAPDGKTIASAADDTILLHDGAKTLQTIKTAGPVSALAYSLDGKTLASGGMEKQGSLERGMIRFWDTATGKATGTPLQHASGVFCLAYVPNTKLLASAGKDNFLRVWDPAAGLEVSRYKGHVGWIGTFAVSAKGTTFFSGSRDGSIKIWSSSPPDVISAHEGPATAVLFYPDDKAIISGGRDGAVIFWDPATGKPLAKLTGVGGVTSLAFSSKTASGILAAGIWNDKNEGEVRLWEVTWDGKEGVKTKELPTLKGHTKGVTCVAFAPDGKTLASGSVDKTAVIWDMPTGQQKAVLKGHEGEIRCLAFPSEGEPVLMTGDSEGMIRQWDVKAGKELRPPLQAHAGAVNAVGYFFGFLGFVTAGEDHSTKFWVWNPTDAAKVRNLLRSNTQGVTSLVFSPDRKLLVTGSLDQSIKLFNSQIEEKHPAGPRPTPFFGMERFTFTGLNTAIRAVAAAPGGTTLAGAGEDGTIRLWRAAPSNSMAP